MLNSVYNFDIKSTRLPKKHRTTKFTKNIAPELRHIIRESVALLGEVIKREVGATGFKQIESIRLQMTYLREKPQPEAYSRLKSLKHELEKNNPKQRYQIARAFTLMIQLMNAAENAYRSHRLTVNKKNKISEIHSESITYVLTAHPTEARSAQNIAVFQEIQKILTDVLATNELEQKMQFKPHQKQDLFHYLEIAWRTPVMRKRLPTVKDEAETLYAQLFREHILTTLMNANEQKINLRIHSWIGSDKDGHPGVNEKTLIQSLTISRIEILKLITQKLIATRPAVKLTGDTVLLKRINALLSAAKTLKRVTSDDVKAVTAFKKNLSGLITTYQNKIGIIHPELRKLTQLLELFPGLVIPMELRESSDIIMMPTNGKKIPAIDRMLKTVANLSRGGDPRWYVRSFIISMTESATHIKMAALKQKQYLGEILLPVVPLFEEATSLALSSEIMDAAFKDDLFKTAVRKHWGSKVEIMVGYSDSSKEAGVFPSRLAIAEALPRLEKTCRTHQFVPVFFHGSGGSVDRGGGTLENQTAWWPKAAANNFKVTIQGEMVERWLATPMIAERQLEKIAQCSTDVLKKKFLSPDSSVLNDFAAKITEAYRRKITDTEFLQIVKYATPYVMMRYLKLGSRPARRSKELTVKSLRAIPWILCWIQTRLLFPVWWGAGLAWEQSTAEQKNELLKAYESSPVFNSYVKALDFTLAKVELAVFKTYLNESTLPKELIEKFSQEIDEEYARTVRFCKSVTRAQKLLDSKQWLQESVQLRAPMIHPLNLLQNIAMKNKEIDLLRLTVTGISGGMMSTG